MATISDFGKSVTQMSQDELFGLLRELRQSRRTNKRPAKSSKKSSTSKKEIDIFSALQGMPQAMRDALIKELEGESEE
uniref:Uncharacterized protein n=1 Tax=viral metagenome TaxID=1070528 RepID=A0A6M3KCN6_9ZZZZ